MDRLIGFRILEWGHFFGVVEMGKVVFIRVQWKKVGESSCLKDRLIQTWGYGKKTIYPIFTTYVHSLSGGKNGRNIGFLIFPTVHLFKSGVKIGKNKVPPFFPVPLFKLV